MCSLYGLHTETSTNLFCTPLSFESGVLFEIGYTGERQKNKMVLSLFPEILASSLLIFLLPPLQAGGLI